MARESELYFHVCMARDHIPEANLHFQKVTRYLTLVTHTLQLLREPMSVAVCPNLNFKLLSLA